VHWAKRDKGWIARIHRQIGDKHYSEYLGQYRTAKEAALVYDAALIERHGEFALTNKQLGLYHE